MASGSTVQLTTTTQHRTDSIQDRQRRISGETACSSNSSCVLQKKKQLHPLAAGVKGMGVKNTPNHRLGASNTPSGGNRTSMVKQRVLSAKYLRFKTLQNELNDANYHIAQLIQENKLLKSLQKRQDHALSRYEGTNAEIPKMIESHQEEVRALQSKIKGLRKNIRELNDYIKTKDDEVNTLKDQNKHLVTLCKNKNLEEREKLTKKVDELEALIRQQDTTISTLNRRVEVEAKNYKFKLAAEVSRSRNLQKELVLAKAQIEQMTNNEEKSSGSDRRLSRTTSNDRKKLNKKMSSSSDRLKKSSDNQSTSSLAQSDDGSQPTSTNVVNKNGLIKPEPNSNSSEDQLKSIVENWQKKNPQDNLTANINEYCLDVIQEAQQVSVTVNQHTEDFKKSEKELEGLLSTLKETDEMNSKFNRVQISSSPVLDFTDMFVKKKSKDRNANLINPSTKIPRNDHHKTKIDLYDVTSEKREIEFPNGVQIIDEEIDIRRKSLASELEIPAITSDFLTSRKSPNRRSHENLSDFDELSSFDRQMEQDFNNYARIEKPKPSTSKENSEKHDLSNGRPKLYTENGLSSTESSCTDLEKMNATLSNFSERIRNVEQTAQEDKQRLLAKLRAIDNGENLSFESKNGNKEKINLPVKKNKNELLKELFG